MALPVACDEPTLAHNCGLKLSKGLENKRHVIVMDNFSNVDLFMDWKNRDILAIGTMQSSCIGLPLDLKDTKRFNIKSSLRNFGLVHVQK